jgi:cytochrome c553
MSDRDRFQRLAHRALRALPAIGAVVILCVASAAPLPASEQRVDDLVKTARSLDAEPKRGQSLFRAECVPCHGRGALGKPKRGIPALAGQRQAYVIRQLANFVEHDRDSDPMHQVVARERIKEPQAWADLAAYLNGLPVTKNPEHGDGALLEFGEGVFREQCASCHEEDARGDEDGFVPSLRNQHYSYLLKQMRALAENHRRNVDPNLVLFIANLKPDELTGLADYLSRLNGPVKDRLKMRDNGVVGD